MSPFNPTNPESAMSPQGDYELTRHSFLKRGGAVLGSALALGVLSGCSGWTPRSQVTQGTVPEAAETTLDDGAILIESGSFIMGSPDSEAWRGADETQREIAVSSFFLSPVEVTEDEYARVMNGGSGSALAVTNVTWLDAVAYCNAISGEAGLTPAYTITEDGNVVWNRAANGYRLPTEAEWEYACRAGTTTPFSMGTAVDPDSDANYYGTYPYGIEESYFSRDELEVQPGIYRQEPVEVATFPPNPWGLYEMHGNVAEWVWDAYADYQLDVDADPTGPESGTLRVNRGGGWNDFAKNLRSAYRAALPADVASPSVGFRVARNASSLSGTVGAFSAAVANVANGSVLIAYYSWGGNTRGIAEEIGRQTGFAVAEIELENPYSTNYNTVLEEAQRDQNQQARPALTTRIDDMDSYSTVMIGYPNWWASIPMPIATFLESYDFAGKTILPFTSSGGGGLGQGVSAISKLAPTATIGNALSIYYSGGSDLASDVSAWLASNGIEGSGA